MKALLRTLCGCTKMIDIPEVRQDLRVPILTDRPAMWDHDPKLADKSLSYDVRTFTFQRESMVDGSVLFIYEERPVDRPQSR